MNPTIGLRPVDERDAAFLYNLYKPSRGEESLWPAERSEAEILILLQRESEHPASGLASRQSDLNAPIRNA